MSSNATSRRLTARTSSAIANQEHSAGYNFWRTFASNQLALFSLFGIIVLVLLAIFGPRLYPVDPNYQNYGAINAWPSAQYPLGTDSLGRDTLARLFKGLQVSLL